MVKGSDSENAADNVLSFVLDQTQLPALGGARCPSNALGVGDTVRTGPKAADKRTLLNEGNASQRHKSKKALSANAKDKDTKILPAAFKRPVFFV